MIRVEPQPEPPGFDRLVRQPGQRALAESAEVLPPYWRECITDLYDAYHGICAYLCVIIPRGTGAKSVDHLAPKSKRRELSYEWHNYRLVCARMNARKRDFEDVLDPFEIRDGWFVLEFSFLQVLPTPDLDEPARGLVQATIDRLDLNDEECIRARSMYYDAYIEGGLTFAWLEQWSPFVARELKRQERVSGERR